MNKIKKLPYLRLVIPVIFGVLLFQYLESGVCVELLYVIFFLLILFVIILATQKLTYKWRWLFGFSVFVTFLVFGMIYFHQRKTFKGDAEKFFDNSVQYFLAYLDENIVEKNKSYKSVLEIRAYQQDSVWIDTNFKVLCYFEKEGFDNSMYPGNAIIVKLRLKEVQRTHDLVQFDYAKYLLRNGIQYQCFVKNTEWQRLEEADRTNLFSLASQSRQRLLKVLENHLSDRSVLAISSAILLGYDDYLDADLRSSYVNAGAMHVLCVSGLHVGIIYLMINFLLSLIPVLKSRVWINTWLILLSVWAYAFITGLSPSIIRASFMLSVIQVGKLNRYKQKPLNSLSASALFIILIDPNLIWHVGFQLSYAAVAGILIFYPSIEKLFFINNKTLRHVWQASVVSVAANIGTFPIVLYYFHQFPNYFLLSNILVLLLAVPILLCGILFLVLSFFNYLGIFFAWLLSKLILLLNYFIILINKIPYGISYYELSMRSLIIYYILILTVLGFVKTKNIDLLKFILLVFIFGFLFQINENIAYQTHQEIHFFSSEKGDWIVKRQGDFLSLVYFGNKLHYHSELKYSLGNYLNKFQEDKIVINIVPMSKKDRTLLRAYVYPDTIVVSNHEKVEDEKSGAIAMMLFDSSVELDGLDRIKMPVIVSNVFRNSKKFDLSEKKSNTIHYLSEGAYTIRKPI